MLTRESTLGELADAIVKAFPNDNLCTTRLNRALASHNFASVGDVIDYIGDPPWSYDWSALRRIPNIGLKGWRIVRQVLIPLVDFQKCDLREDHGPYFEFCL